MYDFNYYVLLGKCGKVPMSLEEKLVVMDELLKDEVTSDNIPTIFADVAGGK